MQRGILGWHCGRHHSPQMSLILLTFDYNKSFHVTMVSYLTTIALWLRSIEDPCLHKRLWQQCLHRKVPANTYAYMTQWYAIPRLRIWYYIPPIVKEKTPLRASIVVINDCQHHYHSSGTDNTCICKFCLTSHSIMSMGHARLVEIL